ncbi:MAG: ABC transporter permease [Haloarculaceae archaeon]
MSRRRRLRSEFSAAWRAFVRRRTAMFFTFLFPLLIVVIFGIVVETDATGGGLFTQPPRYYVPGYLAVVVLFTPLSRVGSEVARHRDGNRFEKLATTPLTRPEWLLAQTAVNVVVIGIAGLLLLALVIPATGAKIALSPLLLLYVVAGVALFCGVGAMLGRLADTQDGVIAASNALALPLLFLSETFVQPELLPTWLPTGLSPLTYFARGVRATVQPGTTSPGAVSNLLVVAALAAVALAVGAALLPRTD